MNPVPQSLILRFQYALGDTVILTALVRDIALTYPGKYKVMLDTHWSPVWKNNPHVAPLVRDTNTRQHVLSYREGIRASGRGEHVHFLAWLHRDFEKRTKIHVPVHFPHGDLHLTDKEKEPLVEGRYWVIVAGSKTDITTKQWYTQRFQEVVRVLQAQGIHCVQAGATHRTHLHPRLTGVLDAVGHTDDVRDLFSLIHGADGVICGVTSAMHIAACFHKPCVVLAGGREEPWWEWYGGYPEAFGKDCAPTLVPHRFLHTIGQLPCCQSKGCWKKYTVKEHIQGGVPSQQLDRVCVDAIKKTQAVPHCLDLVSVDQVAAAVLSYYQDGTLPPVDEQPPLAFARTRGAPYKPPQTPLVTVNPLLDHRWQVLDHPVIGGKVTVCVLCYGEYPKLAKSCLDSILRTVPRERLDLRVAGNEVGNETADYLRGLKLDRLYLYPENRLKYPVMRHMFRDPEAPLTTSHVVWFDDDSSVRDATWLLELAKCITANHTRCALYGSKCIHDLNLYRKKGGHPERWFQEGSWNRDRPWLVRGSLVKAANGSCIPFVAGGFFAISTKVIMEGDIPDPRLAHHGDIAIGAAVHQLGYGIKEFDTPKRLILRSGHPRRGHSSTFPWAAIP